MGDFPTARRWSPAGFHPTGLSLKDCVVSSSRVTLSRALLAAISVSVLVGMIPAGVVLDRRLAQSLIARARTDLETAPRLLANRNATFADAQMMHAKELAHAPGLAAAVARGDRPAVLGAIEAVRTSLGTATALVVTAADTMMLGAALSQGLIDQTRAGKMPVELVTDGTMLRSVALAPLEHQGRWVGAAGVATALDAAAVIGLKGLSRSDVIIASSPDNTVTATTLDSALARAVLAAIPAASDTGIATDVQVKGARYLALRAPLDSAGSAVFVRSVAQELQVLPVLRRTAGLAAAGAIALALLLGAWMAMRVSRPVRQLAAAAQAIGEGRFDTELPDSRIAEVATVAERFDDMRRALQARLVELRTSNEALHDRSTRLVALQSDLMQRERLAAAGRLVAQLAHEIRNPVASLRNCLEVVRRRVAHDPEGVEFADLAIDELLRMHELAEQMLDVSRPRLNAVARCSPVQVARDVVRLVTAGIPDRDLQVTIGGTASTQAAMAGDALKQVLLNLIQNAREAVNAHHPSSGTVVRIDVQGTERGVTIAVEDNGPGIPAEQRERVFDPFFSTKADLHGVGLGLFVAEGLVRSAGGRLTLASAAGGARFVLDLPVAMAPDDLAASLPAGRLESSP